MENQMETLKTLGLIIVTSYIVIFAFSFLIANQLIFFPPRAGYSDGINIIKLKTHDGVLISAMYLPNEDAKYTILVSHGNAEDIGYTEPYLELLREQGFSVFAYDYHGYGTSQGKSTEKNAYSDIDAAYAYLTKTLHINPQNIILYGHSIGAAVALDLAVREKARALIMESPFVTAFRVVTTIPVFPLDKFDNLTKIKKLSIPILIIQGEKDNIVPKWHSKKLYDSANGIKQYFLVPNAGHNDVLLIAKDNYWKTIQNFVKSFD